MHIFHLSASLKTFQLRRDFQIAESPRHPDPALGTIVGKINIVGDSFLVTGGPLNGVYVLMLRLNSQLIGSILRPDSGPPSDPPSIIVSLLKHRLDALGRISLRPLLKRIGSGHGEVSGEVRAALQGNTALGLKANIRHHPNPGGS